MGLEKSTVGKFPWKERCQLCGQYMLPNDEIYIVYPNKNPNIKWGLVHCAEIDKLADTEE